MTDIETPEVAAKGTEYKVYLVDVDGSLKVAGATHAASDTKAIEKIVDGLAGSYVAIPSRYLRVRTVEIHSEPKVVIT